MKTYTVDGTTMIGWSVLIQADTPSEAEEKAKNFWEHNTTYESVEATAVYDENGDIQ